MLRIASAPLVPSSTQGPGRSAALTAGEARNESPQDIANEIAFSKISPHKRLSVYSLTARSRPARTSFAGNASGEEQCQCNATFQNPASFGRNPAANEVDSFGRTSATFRATLIESGTIQCEHVIVCLRAAVAMPRLARARATHGRFLKCAISRDECRLAVALWGANI